jgi:hypothetical protein
MDFARMWGWERLNGVVSFSRNDPHFVAPVSGTVAGLP